MREEMKRSEEFGSRNNVELPPLMGSEDYRYRRREGDRRARPRYDMERSSREDWQKGYYPGGDQRGWSRPCPDMNGGSYRVEQSDPHTRYGTWSSHWSEKQHF